MTLLEVTGLTKRFGGRRFIRRRPATDAVIDVSFSLDSGRTLAIVGESGAGKSTTARLVLRLIEPDAGTIRFGGDDLIAMVPKELRAQRSKMQMIFQDPYGSLDPRFKVGRSVAEPLKVHLGLNRRDRERQASALLERVGLSSHYIERWPHELSGGQLQRVSIARALTVDPRLIVCDEAVAALDVSIRAQVLNLLSEIQEERGIAYLFIAHDLAIVEAFADDVVVMRHGRVVETAPSEQLFRSPQEAYTRELLAAVPDPDPAHRTKVVWLSSLGGAADEPATGTEQPAPAEGGSRPLSSAIER